MINTRKNFTKLFALVSVIGLALALSAAMEAIRVQAHDDDTDGDSRRDFSIPLAPTGLVFGESMRTTLINRGSRPMSLQTSALAADGSVLKQESLVIEPGHTRTFEINCSEAGGGDVVPEATASAVGSVLVRTEVSVRRMDAKHLYMMSAVFDNSTGSTKLQNERISGNHNETLVRDTARILKRN